MHSFLNRFLIVDDDFMIRDMLKMMFCHFGLKCVFAVNGQDALEKWEKEDFLAILMDLDMPIMDGICACREIRQRELDNARQYTPIIAFSGRDVVEGKIQAMEAGMNAFLSKPFNTQDLFDIVLPLAGIMPEKEERAYSLSSCFLKTRNSSF